MFAKLAEYGTANQTTACEKDPGYASKSHYSPVSDIIPRHFACFVHAAG
ncbi:hypothetical protein [uncultured Gimesia sp.]